MSKAVLTGVRPGHEFDVAVLVNYLSQNLPGFQGPLSVTQFEGGQSNPTFLLKSPSGQYVMRKQPPGDLLPSAHQVDREYRVMQALAGFRVPVPAMGCLCMDKAIIGAHFYVMDYVEGRMYADASLPGMAPADRRAIYLDLARVLAEMHKMDPVAIGLADFGRQGNYFSRQISRWTRQYQNSVTSDIDSMNKLIEWLPNNVPESEKMALVHGDFRVGNCLLHPEQPKISAVIDWELSTLGDPVADVGYVCQMYSISAFEFGLGGKDLAALGIPDMDEFVAAYCIAAGLDKVENLEFSIIYNLFRLACISQGVYKRSLAGNASSLMAAEFETVARQYADSAWQMVKSF